MARGEAGPDATMKDDRVYLQHIRDALQDNCAWRLKRS